MSLYSPASLLSLPEFSLTPQKQEELAQTFCSATRIRGDFPSSLSLLEKIYSMIEAGDCTSQDIAKMLRVDHMLALRLISLVNLDYYSSGKILHSVSAAVDHFGLLKLKEILPSLAESKNFNAIFLGHAVALGMMQQTGVASVLARAISEKLNFKKDDADLAYAISSLSNLGPLLLSYYEPAMFSVLDLSCQHSYRLFTESFNKFIGMSLGEFSAAIAHVLQLPIKYAELVSEVSSATINKELKPSNLSVCAAIAANHIAHEICHFSGIQGIQSALRYIEAKLDISQLILEDVLSNVGNTYIEHSDTLALKAMRLPEYLSWFQTEANEENNSAWLKKLPGINQRINPFLYDLRTCMKINRNQNNYPRFPQAIHLTLTALIKGLNFDRAVFFKIIDNKLRVGLAMGVRLFDPENFSKSIELNVDSQKPEVRTILDRTPVFSGEPLFLEGWPYATFPVVWENKVIGIFYADKIKKPDIDSLTNQEQIACTALAEEWKDIDPSLI